MESTRPIRALIRGLDALTVLNLRNGATVSEVAQEIRLPRTTTYRILETLSHAGFVYRDANDDRYRLTIMVRGLSDGYDDEAWVTQIARPYIHELGKDIIWPVAVASLSGTSMMVRESTDHRSPLAVERCPAGFRVPLLASSSGRVYLAFSTPTHRDSLLDILARSNINQFTTYILVNHVPDRYCHIIHMHELTLWLTSSPNNHFLRGRNLRFVEFTHQRCWNMAPCQIKIVIRAIEVCRHQ